MRLTAVVFLIVPGFKLLLLLQFIDFELPTEKGQRERL